MRLTLVRHGDALGPTSRFGDLGRVLSATGREQVRAAARALAPHCRPNRLLCSPLVRAVQTAELVASGLGFGDLVEVEPLLVPDADCAELLETLGDLVAPRTDAWLLCVGHEPLLSTLVSELLGSRVAPLSPSEAYQLSALQLAAGAMTLELRWAPARGQLVR